MTKMNMQRTISIMTGKGSVNHNDRKFTAQNVDKERTKNNVVYCNENIRTVYHKLFDDAVKRYNAKQTRSDRIIKNYYKNIIKIIMTKYKSREQTGKTFYGDNNSNRR